MTAWIQRSPPFALFKHQSIFSERQHKRSTQALTSAGYLGMSPAAQLCPEEAPRSSLLLLSLMGPRAACTQPHFPLLQPTRNVPLSLHLLLSWLTWVTAFHFLDPVLPQYDQDCSPPWATQRHACGAAFLPALQSPGCSSTASGT